jgi:hypothetical protein
MGYLVNWLGDGSMKTGCPLLRSSCCPACCLKPPPAAMTAVAELSLLCQIAKMAWERGEGRFCFFFFFSQKKPIFPILHEATCPFPKFPIFLKMFNKTFY